MASVIRLLVAPALIAMVFTGVGLGAASQANAASPRVVIVDNDGPFPSQGVDPRSLEWGFAPVRMTVLKGEGITFVNPAGNFQRHDVVSISRGGTSTEPALESGSKFNSSPTRDQFIAPGASWVLDTSGLDPGFYTYYCSIHPWMVGTLAVLAP